jgi:phenylpropionate dioxygenase-like ring-hydroxylating dioxygenase large terminal subunit
LRRARRRRRHDYQIAANWKILAENYHECYHCSSIHPDLCEVSPPTSGGDNLEPDHTHVECEWLFSREAVEQEDFDPSYTSDFWDVTNRQDWTACEAVQRGVSSRGYRRGPLSPREDAVYQLITMVANGYLAGGVARPASRAPTPSTLRGSRESA